MSYVKFAYQSSNTIRYYLFLPILGFRTKIEYQHEMYIYNSLFVLLFVKRTSYILITGKYIEYLVDQIFDYVQDSAVINFQLDINIQKYR